jgi:hypothetical protein
MNKSKQPQVTASKFSIDAKKHKKVTTPEDYFKAYLMGLKVRTIMKCPKIIDLRN